MKKILVLFIALLFGANLLAQSANDVIYLNNGSVIKGTASNITPDETVTIQTSDGSVFVLNMSEVTQIAHEENAEEIISSPNWANDIMKRKGSRLFVGDRKLSENEIMELLNEDLFKTYSNGRLNRDLGTVLFLGGIVCLGLSIDLAI